MNPRESGPSVATEIPLDSWSRKRILITGGLGFIGSTLAIRLSGLGAQVTIIDSLIPQYGGNLFNLNGYDDAVRINLSDIRDRSSLEVLLQNKHVIFNLAGQTSHLDSMHDPETDLAINGMAQLSLLELCRRVNPEARIVFASTRQLYGKPKYLPVDESHPVEPVDINGINKLSAELYHRLYADVYGLRTCILRLTNTIGPRMRIRDARQTFVGIWLKQLLAGEPIEVWGGEQLRDFNDVDDVVDAELMIRLHGSGDIRLMSFPDERKKIDIGDYYSCYDRFQRDSGWQPSRSLETTLERTIAYYRLHQSHYL